jgi:hypothetical protein
VKTTPIQDLIEIPVLVSEINEERQTERDRRITTFPTRGGGMEPENIFENLCPTYLKLFSLTVLEYSRRKSNFKKMYSFNFCYTLHVHPFILNY